MDTFSMGWLMGIWGDMSTLGPARASDMGLVVANDCRRRLERARPRLALVLQSPV